MIAVIPGFTANAAEDIQHVINKAVCLKKQVFQLQLCDW